MNYADCEAALCKARCRTDGKPLSAGLRVFDRGTHLAIRYFATDIVRYYPDGTVEINTEYRQPNTLSKIGYLTGVWATAKQLPLYGGRKPSPERFLMVDDFVFKGVNNYLRFGPDGEIDMNSVAPIEIEVIAGNLKDMRAVRKKVREIEAVLKLRTKIGAPTYNYGVQLWLSANLFRPLEEVNYAHAPSSLASTKLTPIWFARQVGALETMQFRKFP